MNTFNIENNYVIINLKNLNVEIILSNDIK